MSIFLGNGSASNIFLGSTPVETIFTGNNLVYQRVIPTTTTTTTTTTSTTTTTAAPSIPTNGLQFYVNAATASSYPGSGSTWYDLSANGYHLTMSGGTFTGSNSIAFNGSQYAALGNNAHLDWPHPTASITLLTFYKPSSTGTISGVRQIACKEETYVGSPIKGYGLQYNGNTGGSEGRFGNDMLGTEAGNQRRLLLETTNAYQTSVFRFNGFTYDGGLQTAGACKLYFDGVSGSVAVSTRANTLTVGSATSNSSNTKFTLAGRNATTTDAFTGRIGAVLQYNRALSATEVTTIYNILSASFTN
jgi:hypothetical protein